MKTYFKPSVFLLLIVLVFVSCSSDSSIKNQYQAEKMLYKAGKLYERVMINPRIANQLDYKNAINAYEEIIERYSGTTNNTTIENVTKRSYLAISELWLLQGEIQSAIAVYEKFLKAYPEDKELGQVVHFANARSNERIYNLNKAISEYQILIDDFGQIEDPLTPNSNILNLPLKVARLQRSKSGTNGHNFYQNAIDYYTSIIEKWPQSPAAFAASYYTASIYADQQKWTQVITIFNKLVREYPDREEIPNILLSMGNLYLDGLNDPNQATRIFEKLLAKYPEHAIAGYVHFGKSRVLTKRGQVERARDMLGWIIENYPDDQNLCASAQLTLASTYEAQGDWDRALVEYRWVQENYPVTAQGLFIPTYIAENYRRRGEKTLAHNAYQDAINHYRNIIKKFPKTVVAGSAQEYIIYCYAAQEEWNNAATAASALQQIYPGSRSEINSALLLGQIYEKMNQFDKAIEVYEKFAREYPNHPVFSQVENKIGSLQQRL